MKLFRFKKLFFIVFLFGMFFQIKAQSRYVSPRFHTVIYSDLREILYVGIDNPIYVHFFGDAVIDTIVDIDNGQIRKVGRRYIVNVKEKGEATISVSIKGADSIVHKVLKTKYRIMDFPKPEVSWALFYDGDSVSLTQIQEKNFPLLASHRWIGCLEGVKYKIQSFEFSILSKDPKIIKTIKVEGNKLNEEALNILKEITAENSIMIDRVLAIGPGGKQFLQSIIIHIR